MQTIGDRLKAKDPSYRLGCVERVCLICCAPRMAIEHSNEWLKSSDRDTWVCFDCRLKTPPENETAYVVPYCYGCTHIHHPRGHISRCRGKPVPIEDFINQGAEWLCDICAALKKLGD